MSEKIKNKESAAFAVYFVIAVLSIAAIMLLYAAVYMLINLGSYSAVSAALQV
ncbi:MAG: hypothetical protein J5922_01630 [Clostridia bacterium]|nr:hypothetical protein [Clostridia bacterium]